MTNKNKKQGVEERIEDAKLKSEISKILNKYKLIDTNDVIILSGSATYNSVEDILTLIKENYLNKEDVKEIKSEVQKLTCEGCRFFEGEYYDKCPTRVTVERGRQCIRYRELDKIFNSEGT